MAPACLPLAPRSELHGKFVGKVQDFIGALAEAHRTAHSERSDSREELESLLNLMARLDFNGCAGRRGVGRTRMGTSGGARGWSGESSGAWAAA